MTAAKTPNEKTLTIVIGRTIRSLRDKRGLSQRQLAERIGIGRPHVCRVENGKTMPNFSTLMRYAAALDTTAWNILLNAERRLKRKKLTINVVVDARPAIEALTRAAEDIRRMAS